MTLNTYRIVHCLIMTLAVIFSCPAQTAEIIQNADWKTESTEDRLTVYSAKLQGTDIVPIRFVTLLDFPPSRVLTVLADTQRRTEWTPNLIEAQIVDRIDRDRKTEYLRYRFPWPFRDRTYLIQSNNSYDFGARSVVIDTRSVSYPDIADTGNAIRAETLFGKIIVQPRDSGQSTYLEAIFLTDVKGHIPIWLVNMIQRNWPRKLVDALIQQLSKSDIRAAQRWLSWDDG